MSEQARSRRILIAIGLGSVLLLAAPLLLRPWLANRAIEGKALALELASAQTPRQLEMCLLRHQAGNIALTIASQDTYQDTARRLAIRVQDLTAERKVQAWLPAGQQLNEAERDAISACANPSAQKAGTGALKKGAAPL